ncbi:MAG: type III pantothenate kinase [Gammaproteobacteria bacterium]|nr:MAG: type III pantothenate kinase [Gammaproteobacteria bacterium]
MILLVDAGNSAIKWCLLDTTDMKLDDTQSAYYKDDEDDAAMFDEIWQDLAAPEQVVISNVVDDEFGENVTQWCQSQWEITPEIILSREQAHGVTNAYTHPEKLGTDRWAAMISGWNRFNKACCIVDCGSAITIDVLSNDGKHMGGLIVPGLAMMQQVLLDETGISSGIETNNKYIGDENVGDEVSLLANDTGSGIHGGTVYAAVALIDRVMADLTNEAELDVICVLTGGDAYRLLPLLSTECIHEPDLVVHGLAIFALGHR